MVISPHGYHGTVPAKAYGVPVPCGNRGNLLLSSGFLGFFIIRCGLHNIDPIAESTQGYGNDCGNDPTIFAGFVLVLYLFFLNCFGVNVFLFAHSLLLGSGILALFHGLPNFVGLRVQQKTVQ